MEMQMLEKELSGCDYPGRGIVIGKSEDGKKAVTAYFIMGRSENSRNRVFVEDGEGIRTQAFDPAKLEDPSLIIYAPVRVLGNEDGWVCGMECVSMELGEPDASGRRRPVEIKDSNFVLDVDCMIMAIGTSPNPLIRSTTEGLETNRKGCLIADDNGATTREGVFAGGDAVTGAATVILAMGAGKTAAAAIDDYIQNK